MKKYFFLAAIAASMFSISSCAKEDEPTDYTESIVGTYSGSVNAGGTIVSQSISVTKVSNTEVRIAPASGTASSSFNAEVTEESDGIFKLTVDEQAVGGGKIKGNSSLTNDPTVNGTYTNSDKKLTYSVYVTPTGGSDVLENYSGTK